MEEPDLAAEKNSFFTYVAYGNYTGTSEGMFTKHTRLRLVLVL